MQNNPHSPALTKRSAARRVCRAVFVAAFLFTVTGCGGSGAATPDVDAIRVQAGTIGGELLVVDDLRDTDTVLWFWAPW